MKNINKLGFTLIELLVVVLIVGILASVALPQYQKFVAKSKITSNFPIMNAIKDAEEIYYMANGSYTDNLYDLDISFPSEWFVTEGAAASNIYMTNGVILLYSDVERLELRFRYKDGIINIFYTFDHYRFREFAGHKICAGDYPEICKLLGGKNHEDMVSDNFILN